MKLLGKSFLFPIFIRLGDLGTFYSDTTEHFLVVQSKSFWFHICPIQRFGGTCRTTTLQFQFGTGNWRRQLSFTWRPDVTHLNWNKESYFKKQRENFKKEYGYYPGEKNIKNS